MGCNQILDRYIEQLIETSTPQAPAWNIEKLRAGKENTWNYIDGCMIKALIEVVLLGIVMLDGAIVLDKEIDVVIGKSQVALLAGDP